MQNKKDSYEVSKRNILKIKTNTGSVELGGLFETYNGISATNITRIRPTVPGNQSKDNFVLWASEPEIDINQNKDNIKIYPNPSTGIYTVDTNDSSDVYETITVYDVLGKQVHQEKVLAKTTTLNIEKLDSGYYFAKLQGTTSSLVIKIIKK